MWQYTVRRILQMIPVLLGVVTIVFFLINFIPGNPVEIMLGPDPEKQLAAERLIENFGLDQPIHIRYGKYLWQLLHFNLGRSIVHNEPVMQMLIYRLRVTVPLATLSLIFAVIFAIPIGIYSATHRNQPLDHISRMFALFGVSTPAFWIGLMLIILFSLNLGWLPTGGYVSILESPLGFLRHMIMPIITLGTALMATSMRITRSSMLEVLREDYIDTARANAVPEIKVIFKHAFRNACLPVLTVIGITLPVLLGGSVLTETIFALPGLGRLTIQALNGRDYPTLMGTTIFFAILFLISMLLIDLAYAYLDPRIRYD